MSKSKRQVAFLVRISPPPDASLRDLRQYIESAVNSWSGSLKPPGVDADDVWGDPLFVIGGKGYVAKVTRFAGQDR